MASLEDEEHVRLFAVINPVSGNSDPEEIRKQLSALCEEKGWDHEVYETTGEENLAEMIRQKVQTEDYNLIVAAGGDGTISEVANALVHTDVPLAIVPVGTGNGLARALEIPLNIADSIQLLGEENRVQTIDAMRIGSEQVFILTVSAGISARSMEETEAEDKQATGLLAYFRTITEGMMEAKPLKFRLEIDGHPFGVEAVEVLIMNGSFLKKRLDIFGSADSLSDGTLEVNLVTADEPSKFVGLAWDLLVNPDKLDKEMQDLKVHEKISIEVEGEPVAVQGDGELIGKTPVEISVEPAALKVVTVA